MDPDTYGGSINSANPSSVHTINTETRSSSRRHQHKKRHPEPITSTTATSAESQDERIEVKILPQDDNWGETTTRTCNGINEDTLTNNNDTSLQLHDNHPHEHLQTLTNNLHRRTLSLSISQFLIYLLSLIAFISPIFFLTIPYALVTSDLIIIEDYSPILTIIFKLIFLLTTTGFLLYRRRNTTYLPRIDLHKLCLTLILFVLIIAYWLYYIFKLLQPKLATYERILSMTLIY